MITEEIPEDEKRIMKIFNASDYDKIPNSADESMKIYFDFLNKNLVFPIAGTHTQETGPFKSETISVNLNSISELYDDFYGILVEGRNGRKKVAIPLVDFDPDEHATDENLQIIDDYKTWFSNW
ncbi:MAG: calcium-binding protein [Nanoarchaeota archaeon]|nr:calcium-binding protein [Nanoarchaeota archaeon]